MTTRRLENEAQAIKQLQRAVADLQAKLGRIGTLGADLSAILSAARDLISTSESRSGTAYGDLATVGPTVTLDTGTTALVAVTARCLNDTAGAFCHMSWEVSGATAISASDAVAFTYESGNAGDQIRATALHLTSGLTAGSNTFTARYRVNTGVGTWSNRALVVLPIGAS